MPRAVILDAIQMPNEQMNSKSITHFNSPPTYTSPVDRSVWKRLLRNARMEQNTNMILMISGELQSKNPVRVLFPRGAKSAFISSSHALTPPNPGSNTQRSHRISTTTLHMRKADPQQ
jgi:hypothetical protein